VQRPIRNAELGRVSDLWAGRFQDLEAGGRFPDLWAESTECRSDLLQALSACHISAAVTGNFPSHCPAKEFRNKKKLEQNCFIQSTPKKFKMLSINQTERIINLFLLVNVKKTINHYYFLLCFLFFFF
jgi:hypothetical protein